MGFRFLAVFFTRDVLRVNDRPAGRRL